MEANVIEFSKQAGNAGPSPKPAIKKPAAEMSIELRYANHIQSSVDVRTAGELMYHWNGNCWQVQSGQDAVRMAFNWLGVHAGKRASAATAESCHKAAMLVAKSLPAKPHGLVIPLNGMWLHVDQQGQINAQQPNPGAGVTHYVPIPARMTEGAYQPSPLPADSMFSRFLQSSLPDPEVREFLQAYIGYTLTGNTAHQVAQFWIGERGGNGKSTMLKIAMALHEKAVPVQLDKLDGFQLSNLIGATMIACDETPKGRIDQQMLKSIISGGVTVIDRKYQTPVSYANTAKVIICANHLPALIDQSDAFWRRFQVIDWRESFTGDKAIHDLDEKIIKNELHLVLDWALLGLQKLQRDGKFMVPMASRQATLQAKLDSNNVASWADYTGVAYCDPDQLYVDKGELFSDYVDYCRGSGLTPCALPQFFTRLRTLFPDVIESRQTVGKGTDKKRVRCVNLTTGVFGASDLQAQVQGELQEIMEVFCYGNEK